MKAYLQKFLNLFLDWKDNSQSLKWAYGISKQYRRYVLGFLVINLVTMLISLVSSVASRYVVDAATGFRSELFFRYIFIMLGASVLSIVISTCSSMFSSYVREKFACGIRADMFDRVQRSNWLRLSKYHSGDLMTRLTNDIVEVSSSVIEIVPSAIVSVVQLSLVLVILLKYDPTLAVIGLIVGPLGALGAMMVRRKYSLYQKLLQENQAQLNAFLQESLTNINVVKTFQMEEANNDRLDAIREHRLTLVMKSNAVGNLMRAMMRLVYGVGYVVAFSWCAYRLSTSDGVTYTYGTMTLFLSLVSQVQGSIQSLGNILPRTFSLLISAKRLREITELDTEEADIPETMPKSAGLRARDLSAGYDPEKGNVLKGLNFEIPAGCRVGIVGSSGAGKTTLIRLLLALLKPEAGTLEYLDEQGRAEAASPATRRFISYVPQGNTLLSGTVRSNLAAGAPNATDEQMWRALELADAADFVRKTAKGLDTPLAERAGGISEGQAQRISIARALLRDRPVLILDEATSALDEATEARVFRRITDGCSKTCFIITHRRSMLRYCDMTLEVRDDGSVEAVRQTAQECAL